MIINWNTNTNRYNRNITNYFIKQTFHFNIKKYFLYYKMFSLCIPTIDRFESFKKRIIIPIYVYLYVTINISKCKDKTPVLESILLYLLIYIVNIFSNKNFQIWIYNYSKVFFLFRNLFWNIWMFIMDVYKEFYLGYLLPFLKIRL